jgi:hypothetical protein
MGDDFDSRILGCELTSHVEAVIGRCVIDDEDAKGGNVLPQHATHAVAKISSVLIARYCNVDAGHL